MLYVVIYYSLGKKQELCSLFLGPKNFENCVNIMDLLSWISDFAVCFMSWFCRNELEELIFDFITRFYANLLNYSCLQPQTKSRQ